MAGLNPLDWPAQEFLIFYAIAFVAAIIAGFAITGFLRPEGRSLAISKDDELAVLAGGRGRLGETVLARMLAADQARIEKSRIYLAPTRAGSTGLERDVLALDSPASWGKVSKVMSEGVDRIERDLMARGLLMERSESRQIGLLAAMPLLLLLGMGLIRYQFGVAAGRPVGILTVFIIVTAIVALIRVFVVNRRTKGGLEAVREAKMRSARLRQAPTRAETGAAVALFGTAVLVGSPMADLHKMRQSDGGSGGGDSGDGGGGGCGGGGCGG